MSVRGSTGSRQLAKQGQTAGHAGEEAERSGSGRGSPQLGTPSPLLLPPQDSPAGCAGKGWEEGCPGPGEAQDAVNSWRTRQSEGSHLGGSALASGPLAAGGWTTTSWQQAPLAALSSLTPGKGAPVRGVMRGSIRTPSRLPIKTTPPHSWTDIPGSPAPLDGTPSLRSWPGATWPPPGKLREMGRWMDISGQCPEAVQLRGGPAGQAVVPDLGPDLGWPPSHTGAIPLASFWAQSRRP